MAWVCPLLNQEFIPMDQYLYYETDLIEHIYFVNKGLAGFVLPFAKNIVYITILDGDYFGEIDFVFPALEKGMQIGEMVTRIGNEKFNFVR